KLAFCIGTYHKKECVYPRGPLSWKLPYSRKYKFWNFTFIQEGHYLGNWHYSRRYKLWNLAFIQEGHYLGNCLIPEGINSGYLLLSKRA
ncbi:MAG: hypothetical protein ACE5KE_16060, partial [Methanosarcinales archaeon]